MHGATVVDAVGDPRARPPDADAAVTTEAGQVLVVLTADCGPLVLASPDAVAVVHVGWLGLTRGVIEAAAARLRAVGPGPVAAALGPCVHPAHYEFGVEDLDRVASRYGDAVRGRTTAGAPALDLPAGIRVALAGVGIDDLHDVDVCTFTSPDHYSHRRDGRTGRQAVVAVLER